ncbi:hypothetical protein DCAR_0830713 [Daucus carota subsp. sativus]|uniref:Uncharacterized protein n=1 Tax=Daucus carota subsp. sativus TaxID=79200 RepID=A0A175YK54_DAUCS|nr:hypothetical protein DCAR_0830713 [Daucus carota subsp. sativus]
MTGRNAPESFGAFTLRKGGIIPGKVGRGKPRPIWVESNPAVHIIRCGCMKTPEFKFAPAPNPRAFGMFGLIEVPMPQFGPNLQFPPPCPLGHLPLPKPLPKSPVGSFVPQVIMTALSFRALLPCGQCHCTSSPIKIVTIH